MNRKIVPLAIGMAACGLALFAATLSGPHSRPPRAERADPSPTAVPAADVSSPVIAALAAATKERPAVPARQALRATGLDEAVLMAQMRRVEETDPSLAIDLARDGNRRFPDGNDAAERAAVIVKSLARQGHLSEARAEAETMVNHYAGTTWALEVEQHTGAHPRGTSPSP